MIGKKKVTKGEKRTIEWLNARTNEANWLLSIDANYRGFRNIPNVLLAPVNSILVETGEVINKTYQVVDAKKDSTLRPNCFKVIFYSK